MSTEKAMLWTFQYRLPPSNEASGGGEWRWRESAKRFEVPDKAAASAAAVQACAALNGIIIECRLAPVQSVVELAAEREKGGTPNERSAALITELKQSE